MPCSRGFKQLGAFGQCGHSEGPTGRDHLWPHHWYCWGSIWWHPDPCADERWGTFVRVLQGGQHHPSEQGEDRNCGGEHQDQTGQLPSAGSSALKDASVEMQKLIQQQLRPEDVESHESIDKHLKEIFNTFSGMVTGELKTVISSVDALLKTEKILEVEHPFSVDGLASLGKDLLDDKQFPTSKYWNNIAQAREKVVNLLTLVSWPNNRKENPIASIANSSKPTLQRYND